jgi:hypothetical protein
MWDFEFYVQNYSKYAAGVKKTSQQLWSQKMEGVLISITARNLGYHY